LVFCKETAFQFGFGDGDAATLVDADSNVVSFTGALHGGQFDRTWSLNSDGEYVHAVPTPGLPNSFDCTPSLGVIINEVSTSVTGGPCGTNGGWVELKNVGAETVDLDGYILCGNRGPHDGSAYVLGSNVELVAGQFALFCQHEELNFEVGAGSSIFLYGEAAGAVLSAVYDLPSDGVYAYECGSYIRTFAMTPLRENMLLLPAPCGTTMMVNRSGVDGQCSSSIEGGGPVEAVEEERGTGTTMYVLDRIEILPDVTNLRYLSINQSIYLSFSFSLTHIYIYIHSACAFACAIARCKPVLIFIVFVFASQRRRFRP
jgi:hypothetical protein